MMKGPSGESNVDSEGVKLLKTVRRQVEPATTIFPNFSIVDVYQVVPSRRKCNTIVALANCQRWSFDRFVT